MVFCSCLFRLMFIQEMYCCLLLEDENMRTGSVQHLSKKNQSMIKSLEKAVLITVSCIFLYDGIVQKLSTQTLTFSDNVERFIGKPSMQKH